MVQIRVYDILGRLVRTLVSATQEEGDHTVRWDATDSSGVALVSGTYFYQIMVGDFVQTKSLVLLK